MWETKRHDEDMDWAYNKSEYTKDWHVYVRVD